MSWTYNPGNPGPVDYVRFLIADTDILHPIMQDEEINNALFLTSTQGLYQNSALYATGQITTPTVQVYSVWYAAAACLDAMASNKSYLASVQQLLDVRLDASKAAAALRAQAKEYRQREDDAAHFCIIEQITTAFQARERWWAQLLRVEGGS